MSTVFSGYNLSHTYVTVVYHLHGKTVPFTVWVMVRPGFAFTIILYKSVPVTEKRPRRSETGIKDGLEEMEHEFPFVRPEEQE